MSDAGEIQYPNDRVLITVDIEDCPLVEFPLCDLFDLATSTLVDNYLRVLQEHVMQAVEDTPGLDQKCKLRLCCTAFGVFYRRDDGGIFSMRKPALQRRIAQTLRSRTSGSHHQMEIPIFIRFMLPEIYLPPRRSEFPVSVPRVQHTDISPCSSPTTFQLPIPNSTVRGLGNNTPEPGAVLCCTTPDHADSCGASATQTRHGLQSDARATVPQDTTTLVPILPVACVGAPHMSASGVAALDGCDLAIEDPVVTVEETTDADVGIASFTGHTLSRPMLCSSPANFDRTPIFFAHCETEKASSAVLQNMHCSHAVVFVATDDDGSDQQLTPIPLEVGVKSTGNNSLFVDGMRVTDEQAPDGIVVVTADPMIPGIGNMGLGFDHLHTVPVFDCITATAPSYGFPLRGHDSGIRPRSSLPSLLTRYQPIDRGRCHFNDL
jgi:hypothetical protein